MSKPTPKYRFKHFSDSERDQLAILLHRHEYSLREIADTLDRVVSAVSYEISKNSVNGVYDAKKAILKARVRRKASKYQGMVIANNPALQKSVEDKLLEGRSCESIAGRIRNHEKNLPPISGNSIRRYLASSYCFAIRLERQKLAAKKKRRQKHVRSGKLDGRTFIDERPKDINERENVGDAEADFIVSGRNGTGRLLVIIDRKIRATFIEKIWPVTIENIKAGFIRIKKRYPEMNTFTTDNDILLINHKELEKVLGVKIYFAHAYSSWEKGSVENVNGVIREFGITKSSDISKYSKKTIAEVEHRLNDRYMKCLDYATPQEKLNEHRKKIDNQKAPD
jgi:IS30 family transposase